MAIGTGLAALLNGIRAGLAALAPATLAAFSVQSIIGVGLAFTAYRFYQRYQLRKAVNGATEHNLAGLFSPRTQVVILPVMTTSDVESWLAARMEATK